MVNQSHNCNTNIKNMDLRKIKVLIVTMKLKIKTFKTLR